MTIYKPKSERKEKEENLVKELEVVSTDSDDDAASDDGDRMNLYSVKTKKQTMFCRRKTSILTLFTALLMIFVMLTVLISVFWHRKPVSVKPYIGLVRMQYHLWKYGGERSLKMEGEFHQQVEIDVNKEDYEKLSVPPVLKAQRATILHDFKQKLTAVISLDRGHCFVLPLNTTFVTPLREFYQLAKNIEAGYDSADAEVITDDYSVLSAQIKDVSQFGQHIRRHCQYLETYRLVRDPQPVGVEKKTPCHFRGEQYCLGNAGTEYMGIVHISQCRQ